MRFTISDDVVHRELEGEAVVLSLGSGMYFGLNPTGTRVWSLIETGASVEEIAATISEEFSHPLAEVRADVDEVIGQLLEKGLVAAAPADA